MHLRRSPSRARDLHHGDFASLDDLTQLRTCSELLVLATAVLKPDLDNADAQHDIVLQLASKLGKLLNQLFARTSFLRLHTNIVVIE